MKLLLKSNFFIAFCIYFFSRQTNKHYLDGGGDLVAESGKENIGGGGGTKTATISGAVGSGIVIIRNKR